MGNSNGNVAAQNATKVVAVNIPSIYGEFRTHQTTKEDGTVVNHRALLVKCEGMKDNVLYFPVAKLVAMATDVNPSFGLYWQYKMAKEENEPKRRMAILSIAKHVAYTANYVEHKAGDSFGDVVFTADGFHETEGKVVIDKMLNEAIEKVTNIDLL